MICPRCQFAETKVVDSRAQPRSIRRRRECLGCSQRFTTYERIDRKLPLVLKRDGSRQPFQPDKVWTGLQLACRKREVSSELVDAAVESIIDRLHELYVEEVPSQELGEMVLTELKEMDMVAYLRFASVYRNVHTPSEFLRLLSPWIEGHGA
jgi:transcriptional repressor NrdR